MFTRLTCRYRLHFITFSLILLWLLNDQHELLTEKLRKKAKPFTGSFARPRSYFSAQLTYLNPSYLSHLRNQTVQISKTIFPFKEGLDPGWKLRNQNTLKRLLDCQSHLPDSNCQEKDNHITGLWKGFLMKRHPFLLAREYGRKHYSGLWIS
ncbi:hypothetical protein BY996DRAFT_3713583 [Phakopsora pachyrhizi]|nr:hypothetical protein BY996DRAFT_3713583 [Phakopsora pachyrhizi]